MGATATSPQILADGKTNNRAGACHVTLCMFLLLAPSYFHIVGFYPTLANNIQKTGQRPQSPVIFHLSIMRRARYSLATAAPLSKLLYLASNLINNEATCAALLFIL